MSGDVALGQAHISAGIGFGIGDIESVLRRISAENRAERQRLELEKVPQLFRPTASGTTDTNGNLTLNGLWQIPSGYRLYLHRVLVDYPGSNLTSPHTCQVRLFISGASNPTLDPTTQVALSSALPTVFEWSNPQVAPAGMSNESVSISIAGGPVSTPIVVSAQFTLGKDL